jgi:hypothetical protein
MSAMYNMRLPASESAKLAPARTREHDGAAAEDVARAQRAEDDLVATPAARPRLANHLSGFARA